MEGDILSLPARQYRQFGFSLLLYTSVPEHDCSPLICVVGPTGAGKSEFAIRMAESLDGEIVSCDSLQIYRGFDIGSAKVALAERHGIPHHLIDVAEPEETFTAGEYARRARAAIADISSRGKTPIVAGGTAFYLRALPEGLSPLPERNEALRGRLRRLKGSLHRLLQRLDRQAAERIHPNDTPKLMRALEIRILTGRPADAQEPPDRLRGYQIRKIGLFPPRQHLYAKLDRRCEWMFANGLIEEARALLARGVPPNAKPFESIGYRQALAHLRGEMDLPSAIAEARQAHRNYAKRQLTWFRHEQGIELTTY
jgi:tRNA dimethylallyltransferase